MLRKGAALLLSLVAAVSACSFTGKAEVRRESGNQRTGYLSRPMQLTTSSDESIEQVAQGICDNVYPDSTAKITFIGKVPGPGPIDLADWGRYRYDCEREIKAPAAAAPRGQAAIAAPPVVPAAAPVRAAGVSAKVEGPAVPVPVAAGDEAQRRECLRVKGLYQICLGSCLLGASGAVANAESECLGQCAAKAPAGGCN